MSILRDLRAARAAWHCADREERRRALRTGGRAVAEILGTLLVFAIFFGLALFAG